MCWWCLWCCPAPAVPPPLEEDLDEAVEFGETLWRPTPPFAAGPPPPPPPSEEDRERD